MASQKADQLLINIDADSRQSLYEQVYEQIRDAIIAGKLAEDVKLPAIKRLASSLSVSHTTIELSYAQLCVEGYVRSVPRSGYRVNKLDTDFLQRAVTTAESEVRYAEDRRGKDVFSVEHAAGKRARYDFSFANLPAGSFPLKAWRKAQGEIFYTGDDGGLTRYTYSGAPHPFRTELAAYLGRTRGVTCIPEQVIPQAGTDCALSTLFQLMLKDRPVVGIEQPGYPTAYEVAERFGFTVVELPTDQGGDAFIQAIEDKNPNIVFATPSHQFPTGVVLKLDIRTRLLKWAEEHGSYVIEDDSCCEYRYDIRPVPSLQSLDTAGRVIYLGNFSKALGPGLRLAYLVLPPNLMGRYYESFNNTPPAVPWLTEEILARLMSDGTWESHLRKIGTTCKKNHDELLRCLNEKMGERVRISGMNAGMHVYVTVYNGMTQAELIGSARSQGVAVYSTKRFWHDGNAPENNVLIGFCSIPFEDIEPGVDALVRAWFGPTPIP